jgi:hypothetical protein
MQSESRATPIGPVLGLVGGALLVAGSFLEWLSIDEQGVIFSATGIDGDDGWITFGAGVIVVACSLLLFRVAARGLALLVVVAGLAGAAVGVYDAVTAEDSYLDARAEAVAPQFGASADEVRILLDQAIEAGEFEINVSYGVGLYLVVGGGALSILGGLVHRLSGAKAPQMPEPVAGGASLDSEVELGLRSDTADASDGVSMAPPAPPPPPMPTPPSP